MKQRREIGEHDAARVPLSKQQIQMLFHIHRSSPRLFNVVSCCPSFFFAFRLRTVMTGCFVRLDKDQANIIVASSSPMIDYRSRDIHTAPVNGSNHTMSTNDEHLLRPRSSKAIVSPRAQRVQRNTGMLITFLLFDAK